MCSAVQGHNVDMISSLAANHRVPANMWVPNFQTQSYGKSKIGSGYPATAVEERSSTILVVGWI